MSPVSYGAISGGTLLSQVAISRRTTRVLMVCFFALGALSTSGFRRTLARDPNLQEAKALVAQLRFMREVSSADDVRRGLPPVVDRSLNIIAGHADPRTLPEKLVSPRAVVTDSNHRLYVVDSSTDLVHVFDFGDFKYSVLGGPGSELRSPSDVAVDRDNYVYVTDRAAGVILVYDQGGRFLRYLGRVGTGETYFQAPTGIAIQNETGHIYVCDSRRHMVILLDKQGHILSHFGRRWGGKAPGDFRYPSRIVIAGDELLVLDSGNSRLQVLDLNGHFRREIQFQELSSDAGLALDSQKNIYVSDQQLGALNVFNYEGQLLYKFGRSGKGPGEFSEPSGMWVGSGNRLYVADTKNGRVQEFEIPEKR